MSSCNSSNDTDVKEEAISVNIIHDKPKVHSLTGRITMELMLKAFKAVKRNRGVAGVDKVSIGMFERNLETNLYLIERFLKSGVMEEGQLKPTVKGTPQGGVISPLLANIVLNHLDWHMASQGMKIVRYADDFVILCKTYAEAEKALIHARTLLEESMDLELSTEKTRICHVQSGFDFLGFRISSRGVKMRLKSEEKFKKTVREITKRSRNLDRRVIERLNSVIRGTVNYFYTKFSSVRTQFLALDKWVRARIRMMKYKRNWSTDNYRLLNKHMHRMGLLSCKELGTARLRC